MCDYEKCGKRKDNDPVKIVCVLRAGHDDDVLDVRGTPHASQWGTSWTDEAGEGE